MTPLGFRVRVIDPTVRLTCVVQHLAARNEKCSGGCRSVQRTSRKVKSGRISSKVMGRMSMLRVPRKNPSKIQTAELEDRRLAFQRAVWIVGRRAGGNPVPLPEDSCNQVRLRQHGLILSSPLGCALLSRPTILYLGIPRPPPPYRILGDPWLSLSLPPNPAQPINARKTPPVAAGRNLRHLVRDPLGYFQAITAEYGDIVCYRPAPDTAYLINHPDFVRHVLVDNNRNYSKETHTNQVFNQVVAEGLLTTEGDTWRRQRRMMQPAFHRTRLELMDSMIAEATGSLLQSWREAFCAGTGGGHRTRHGRVHADRDHARPVRGYSGR